MQANLVASFFASLLAILGLCYAEHEEEEPVPVNFTAPFGSITGLKSKSRDGREFYEFKAIPYAHVPLRFMDSVEVPPWDGIRDGTEFGSQCIQHGMGDEECLFINVFTPSLPSEKQAKYPVLVWIHGGYFIAGSANIYAPNYFMDDDVVVVTLNYRLSVFGFLNFGIEEAPGNQGMKDQVMALKWVQKNIKHFNGDESSVTIFGESAGAASVSYLVLSPLSKGLFHRAISQSGTAACAWAYNADPEGSAAGFAKKLACTGSKQEMIECLRKVEPADVMKALPGFLRPRSKDEVSDGVEAVSFVPSAERREATEKAPVFLSQSPMETLKEMPTGNVPWMIGFNSWEGYVFTHDKLKPELLNLKSAEEVKAEMRRSGPGRFRYGHHSNKDEVSDKIHQFYFGDRTDVRHNLSTLITDFMFLHCSVTAAQLYSDKGPVYFYQYEEAGSFSLVSFLLGGDQPAEPSHGDEMTLQWFFNSPFISTELFEINKDSKYYKFSKDFINLWIQFATHGKPGETWGGKALGWNPITSPAVDSQMWMHLKDDATVLPINDDIKGRLALAEQLNVTLAY